jgi:hypothetical protein
MMNPTHTTSPSHNKEATMRHVTPSLGASATSTRLNKWHFALLGMAAFTAGLGRAHAQTIDDHSLLKSLIKTFHVKCSSGRLGMVRYDTRPELTNMCVSVRDGSSAQRCMNVTQQQAAQHVNVLGPWACQ